MDRDFDIDPRPEQPRPPLPPSEMSAPDPREPEVYQLGQYRYRLSPPELAVMADIGRFRMVAAADLERFQYAGFGAEMRREVNALKLQGLVQERMVNVSKSEKLAVLTLTKQGKRLLDSGIADRTPIGKGGEKQAYYSGVVKPNEIKHDASIYPMFQAEKARIEEAGGRIRRIILDYELKRSVYKPLAKAKPNASAADYARMQEEVARHNGLKVTGGKILLPDLRIEYETAAGVQGSLDLEVATHHYRGAGLRGKAEAGFKLYASADSAARIAAYDPELMVDIFSF